MDPIIPLRSRSRFNLCCLIALLLVGGVASRADDSFAAALAELKAQRAEGNFSGMTTERLIKMNDAFLARVDVRQLTPRELLAVAMMNPFSYGEKARVAVVAVVERLQVFATQTDTEGALAAALRFRLAGKAGIPGATRTEWADAYLQHPAFDALVAGEHGDFALDVACGAAHTDAQRQAVVALIARLDPAHPTAAAWAVQPLWELVRRAVPEGEARQAQRAQLADYLSAALAADVSQTLVPENRTWLEKQLTALNGVEARGQFIGHPAPELHFEWSSREGWQTLSQLRGKVVVLDFWATWCAPCTKSFPEVAALTARYRDFPVVIIGVTSVQGTMVNMRAGTINCKGDPAKEHRLMTDYIAERGITWPIVFSREPVMNPDYGINGVPTMAIIAPDGTVRHCVPGLTPAKAEALIDAVLTEFKLPAPTANK